MTLEKAKPALYSRSTFAFGTAALMVALAPFFASEYTAIPFIILFLFLPVVSGLLSLASLLLAAVKKIKFGNEQARKKTHSIDHILFKIGFTEAITALVISIFFVISFINFRKTSTSMESSPVGEIQVHFYGSDSSDETGVESIILSDSTILTTGIRKSNAFNEPYKLLLTKSDISGNLIWQKEYSGRNGHLCRSDNNVMFASLTESNEKNSASNLTIRILDNNGGILKLSEFPVDKDAQILDCIQSCEGAFYLAGTVQPDHSNRSVYSFLYRLNDAGDSLWSRKLDAGKTGELMCVGSVLTGGVVSVGLKNQTDRYANSFTLTKINQDGAVSDSLNIFLTNLTNVSDIEMIETGGFVITGNKISDEKTPCGFIMEIQPNGKTVWKTEFTSEIDHFLTNLEQIDEFGWLATGWAPQSKSVINLSGEGVEYWETYFIGVIAGDGSEYFSFHGGKENFIAWDLKSIDFNRWIITGFGGKGDHSENGKLSDYDVGIIDYKLKTEDFSGRLNPQR